MNLQIKRGGRKKVFISIHTLLLIRLRRGAECKYQGEERRQEQTQNKGKKKGVKLRIFILRHQRVSLAKRKKSSERRLIADGKTEEKIRRGRGGCENQRGEERWLSPSVSGGLFSFLGKFALSGKSRKLRMHGKHPSGKDHE